MEPATNPVTTSTKRATIKFYGTKVKYGEFSNFYKAEILVEGKTYQTTEHYFQAVKFINDDEEYFEKVRTSKNPAEAKKLGKAKKMRRTDWNEVKYDIMKKALRAKFTQHEDLKNVLLGTGDAELIENAPRDYQWGCGAKGTGLNLLGKALMDIRDELNGEDVEIPVEKRIKTDPITSVGTLDSFVFKKKTSEK